jgi:HAD superfamily hydrolase (TIGR01549 family)
MSDTKVISFDLDGTITDTSFVDSVWLEGLPHHYAVKNHVSFEDAKKHVWLEYDKVGREKLEWYDLSYWIRKLRLNAAPKDVLNSYQHKIRVYPEVQEVLEEFKDNQCRLIIVSNARREFLDIQLEKTGINCHFERAFFATSDFRLVKKTPYLYQIVCSIIGVSTKETIHVGDDWHFDFDVPNKIGITSFYLDRTGEEKGECVVHSLKEFSEKLERAELV